MKINETYIYYGYTINFEYHKNRKHLEYTAICICEGEKIIKHDDTLEGAKTQMEIYIDNIPKYREVYNK